MKARFIYHKRSKLRSLHDYLSMWQNVHQYYHKHAPNEDCMWWYNERASIGSLAAAIWRAGGLALEEYVTQKGRHQQERSGRCDLYINTHTEEFACEAKHVWCPIGRRNTVFPNPCLKAAMKHACHDAGELYTSEGRRLALCFAVPYLPVRDEDVLQERLEEWTQGLFSIDCSAICWTFPLAARFLKARNRYFPGVALLIKEVYKARAR